MSTIGAAPLATSAAPTLPPQQLAAYGLFGMPLAMMALPVYVLVPNFYAETTGLALTLIGAILLGARLLDAITDPLLGAWVDASGRGGRPYMRPVLFALPPLVIGFALLFSPPTDLTAASTAAWLAATLVAATLGYSLATIAYQAWGAELARDDAGRARITAWREGAGLVGVLLAALVPAALGMQTLVALFAALLAVSVWLLARAAPQPAPRVTRRPANPWQAILRPLATARFRWLLAVFMANGIAAAIPASLVLFFISDRLQLPAQSGVFLALYFAAGAASMPLWISLARRWSLHAVWIVGMVASIAAFVWAYGLAAGDFAGFAAICVLSGAALGADLALPPALLARVIDANGDTGARAGSYFGVWGLVSKLNLALAAGIALPALEALGYRAGSQDPGALAALAFAYAVLPCVLKLGAAGLLLFAWRTRRF